MQFNSTCPEKTIFLEILPPPVRNYKRVELTGEREVDSSSLDSVRASVRNIVRQNDTHAGIYIHFGSNTKYQELINVLDICDIDGAKIYEWVDNSFWIAPIENSPKKGNKLIQMEPLKM